MNKRILFLADSLSIGGAERQLALLAKYLSPGWESRVVALGGGPFYHVLLSQGVSVAVYQRSSRFDLGPVCQLYSEIARYRPDIIHSWGWVCSALVAPLCKVLRVPWIDGSIRIGGASRRHYWRTRITLALSDQVVANSLAGLSAYNIPAEKGSVVYNAIDPDRMEFIKQKSNIKKNTSTVIMTGRMSPFKDFPLYFEAARRLSAQMPGCWRFIAIGGGEEKNRVNFVKLAKELVSAGVVELPQAGLEVLPYLREANIGVLLSIACFKEGISNSIMEYMACELPVVCSDSGGNRELVIDRETGFVIPPEDVDALIEKLIYLRNHPDIADRMGKAGYKRIASLYSVERMVSEYEALYFRLLGESRNRT